MTESGRQGSGDDMHLELPEPARKNRRWTLLMVSDTGRIVRVRRIRGWITLLAALPVLAALIVAGGYLRSDRLPAANRHLAGELERLQEEVQRLRSENAAMGARQSPPGSEEVLPEEAVNEPPPAPGVTSPASGPPAPVDSGGSAAETVRPVQPPAEPEENAAADSVAEEEIASQAAEGAASDSEPEEDSGMQVAVKDLALDYNADKSAVSVAFKIFNRRADGGSLFGFAFVILKTEEQSPEQWLAFPETDLTPRGPVSFRRGYDFSISNYMVVRFNPRPVPPGVVFRQATIQVYDASGRILLDRDFQL